MEVQMDARGYDTMAEASTDAHPRWVAEEHARVSEMLTQLDKTLDLLATRLAPILAPDSPHAMPAEKADTPTRSPLADELGRNAALIGSLTDRVLRIEARLEI